MARVAVIPGDGIGLEVVPEAVKVCEAAAAATGAELRFERFDHGAQRYLDTGLTLTDEDLETFKGFDALFVGALGDPRIPDSTHARDILLGLRFRLDLYVNQRPIRLLHERFCPLKGKSPADVDMVMFRENTEGAYVGMGGIFKKGTPDEIAIQEDVNTRKGVERILRHAFEFARARGRRKVTMADKSNAMRFGHDIWLRVFHELGEEYPEIEKEHQYVDALAMMLVRHPERFDVLVSCNLFGDILTDLGAALQGGLGLSASANLHPGAHALFEPVHGSAPDIAGRDAANPLGAVLAGRMMLEHLGLEEAAALVGRAVSEAIEAGALTADLGGSLGTRAAGDDLAARVEAAARG